MQWLPDENGGGMYFIGPYHIHTFDRFIDPGYWFGIHPEFFAYYNGQRNKYSQLCLTNPDVYNLLLANCTQLIENRINDTDIRLISISPNDNDVLCRCENCSKLNKQYGENVYGSLFWFVNEIAKDIKKFYPNKPNFLIDTIAYGGSEKPPTGLVFEDNVNIRVCPINIEQTYPMNETDNENNKSFLKNLDGWSKIVSSLQVWHYIANSKDNISDH